MRGRFVVIEGINGAGGETQSKRLVSYLESRGIHAVRIHYPEYGNPIGNAIRDYLFGKFDPSPITLFLLYASDMAKDAARVESLLQKGTWVVADRHFTSTLAYQSLVMKALPLEKALKFAEVVGIPRPDAILYLRVSVATSVKRKLQEHKKLDRHESDSAFQERIQEAYEELARKSVLGRWTVIDAEPPIGQVFGRIRDSLKV
jgi:dTMP kinase